MTDQSSISQPEKLAPNSPEAEEAVLGSILINPDAIFEVAAFLQTSDFFIVRNAWVWDAINAVHERGEAIDNLTVIEELRHRGQLESIGGSAYITYLINNTPTHIHAETYGRIVERAAIRRRLLSAASDIAQTALEENAEINEVIDHAESTLFGVTERRLRKEMIPIRLAVSEYFDRIEYLYGHQDEPLGLPTGFGDLDKLLGGLQKSDLCIIASRPGVGKTSLMLSVALNAAKIGNARVAIYSMEMATEQLVQRLVSAETGINSQKLRLGNLDEREWSLFTEATGKLGNLRLYLDDTPAISIPQIRTKSRRLYREHGLDLIIVDYLQLMTAGVGRNENRVQEISYISRGLKELARELNVPVLAAAQLSRAVEQRQDKRPQLSDLRESGCLAGDALVYLPEAGHCVPIRELAGRTGFCVASLNMETWKLENAQVTNAFCTGVKPVYHLTTQLGRSIRATANHQFLTFQGWKRLDELTDEDSIALPRVLNGPAVQTMADAELALLGHLIGDGCTLPRHTMQYTTRELELAELVVALATEVFRDKIAPRINRERGWYQVYLPSTRHLTHGVRNPLRDWLEDLGIFGLRSYEKWIPQRVFEQPREAIALFLRHLWATDGCIGMHMMRSLYPAVYYASSSEKLARGVQSLLLRLGINARLKRLPQVGKGRDQYHVILTGNADLEVFASTIGTVGCTKQQNLEDVTEYLQTHSANTNRDVIPYTIWRMHAVPAMQQNGVTTRQLHARMGNAYCGTAVYKQNIGRERAAKLAQVVKSEAIALLAGSDIYWDRIDLITPDGETDVYDLTVPSLSNFVADDLIAHNSIEQDADIVMFIYRDDLYNENSDRPNQADILISKHRNGPTGVITLYFRKEITQFTNMQKSNINLATGF